VKNIDLREKHQLEKMARERKLTGIPKYDYKYMTRNEIYQQMGTYEHDRVGRMMH
jgi:hypothetical protein